MLNLSAVRVVYVSALMGIGLLVVVSFMTIDHTLHFHDQKAQLWLTIQPPSIAHGVIKQMVFTLMWALLACLVLIGVFVFRPMEQSIQRKEVALVGEIAQRKQAEQTLREAYAELDRFFALSRDMLAISDYKGFFTRVSPEWQRTLGYDPQELMSKSYLEFVHPDDLGATRGAMDELDAQLPILNFANRYRHKDGTYRLLEWRSSPAGDKIYGAARDITERGQKERAKLLADFISNTSHELRTPLTIINSSAYLIKKLKDEDKRQEKVAQIFDQVAYLDRMITQLQDMAGLNQIRDLALSKIDLCALVKRFLAFYANKRADVEVKTQPCPDVAQEISGDTEYLTLAIGYLVDNALRYAPPESDILVYVEAAPGESRVCVQDHGVGIPDEHVERIFEQFYKADPSRTQNDSAAGMGLTMTRRIMELHNGQVKLLSHRDGNTIFALCFPR